MDMESVMKFQLPPELVERYVTRRYEDVETCFTAVKDKNYIKVAELAHQMKGNGTSFGFPLITELGAQLEVAAKNNDFAVVNDRLEKLHQFLKSVK